MLPRTYHKPFPAARLRCFPALLPARNQRPCKVLLTVACIKCSLVLLFSIVNFGHGTGHPATTRVRPAPHRRIPHRPPSHHGGPACAHGSPVSARGSSHHS